MREPIAELGPFSSPSALPTPWARARNNLADAELYWLSTVRPGGQPHVTPLLGIWLEGAFHFTTGSTERKAENLALNPLCVVTTGHNTIEDGLDVVLEGEASKVLDSEELQRVAATYETKYGSHFTAPGGTWFGLGDAIRGGSVLVYRVAPSKVLGFGKGKVFSQTRFAFPRE